MDLRYVDVGQTMHPIATKNCHFRQDEARRFEAKYIIKKTKGFCVQPRQ